MVNIYTLSDTSGFRYIGKTEIKSRILNNKR